MATKLPLSPERLAEIANQSFVTETNQKAFGVDKKADVAVKDYKQVSGITTSDDAANRAKNADKTINDITTPSDDKNDPFKDLFSRINTLQQDLNKAKEAEKKAKEAQANADVQAKLKGTPSAEEAAATGNADMNAAATAINGDGTTQNIQDPVIRARADKMIANVGIINNQMQTLSQYRKQFNEYTQQDIDSIARTAERSIQRQVEENKRTTDAMRFAGVLAGRAQFAPVTEQSIIAEVIQDGLDKIEVINEKKNSAIREARKAEAEFNVDIFEQQAELAKEYNNEIESTISAMNAQVRQVEADERERTKFRQEQADRSAFILAPELINATPEEIQAAALANGIDPGLLAREVQGYQDERQMTNLDIEGKKMGLKLDEANLIGQRISNAINQEELNELRSGEKEDPLTPDELLKWNKYFGYTGKDDASGVIPPTWTRDDLNNFVTSFGNAPKEDIPRLAEQYNSLVQIQNGEDVEIKGVMPTEEVVSKVVEKMETAMLAGQGWFGKGSVAAKMADQSGTSKSGRWGSGDAKTWFESKGKADITTRAKEMAEQGLEWYEIVDQLSEEYSSLSGTELNAR